MTGALVARREAAHRIMAAKTDDTRDMSDAATPPVTHWSSALLLSDEA